MSSCPGEVPGGVTHIGQKIVGGDNRYLSTWPAEQAVGHVLCDEEGCLLSVDTGFCDIMRMPASLLVGQTVLAITTPEDRAEIAAKLAWLRLAEMRFTVRSRYLRGDGSLAWVDNTVALLRDGAGSARIVATVTPISPPASAQFPGNLLNTARFLLESRRRRDRAFDTGLFSDPAWDILLAAYVCEAEGGTLTARALCDSARIPAPSALRWTRLLLDTGLLEAEETVSSDIMRIPLRLSGAGHRRFERYLAGLLDWHDIASNREHVSFGNGRAPSEAYD